MNHGDGGFYPKVFALATASLLGYALVRMALPFAGSIVWALLLAFLLYPLNEMLSRALRGRRGLAALLLTLAGLVLILGPGALIAVAFATQAGDLVARIQEIAERHHVATAERSLANPDRGAGASDGSGPTCPSPRIRSRPGWSRTAAASS